MKAEEVVINARVFVDHLEEVPPDTSLESRTNTCLEARAAHTTGILRLWVAGQVGRAIWMQADQTARLVPHHLSELDLVQDCVCAAMEARPEIQYPQGWDCPYHGFVRKGAINLGMCAQLEAAGRTRQKAVE